MSIKRHPANSRRVALPHLHANSTGLSGFVRILRISPRLPPSLPTTSVDRNAKGFPRPPRLKFAVSHKQSSHLTVSSHGGKDNPPPSVISIVHQQVRFDNKLFLFCAHT
ncbi:MAG: hypothetical protein ACXWPG_12390, partial [Ktedonobacteraceae bacterium]